MRSNTSHFDFPLVSIQIMTDNSTAPLLPSAPFDTPTDHRSLLDVIAWLFTIISFMVVATRCGTRWAVSRIFALDDALIIISLVRLRNKNDSTTNSVN